MCGIAGFWQKTQNYSKDLLKNEITKMTDALIHRGPDDTGVWVNKKEGLAFGHRRLSILDLSPLGHQPMESFSGRYVIVYNGEVYNYKELKKEIGNNFNVKFRGNSDTEVILAGFEAWGFENTLKKMNGMFAIALWDKKEKKLCLARDRIGIKPLYYGINNGTFYFASELKAIRVHSKFKSEIDINSLALYFRHNYIPSPYSIYENINKLLPGHWIIIDKNFNIELKCYWNARRAAESGLKNQFIFDENILVSELEKLLKDSVKKRMMSDVPLGAFLSGGVDSSTVVALMQAQSSIPIKTFSIGFYEDQYNEAKFAKAVAKHLGTDHTELYVTPKEAMDVIPKLSDMYDEPFSDSSQIPTFLVSQLAKKYVTVSLSGDGGDELFGGYNRYLWADKIWRKVRIMPHPFKVQIAKFISTFSPDVWDNLFRKMEFLLPMVFRQTLYGDKLYKLSEILTSKSPDEIYKRLISHWKDPGKLVIGSKEPKTILGDQNIKGIIPKFKDRMMFFDLLTYLPDDILTKVDRASMAVSLEARVPLLDHRVVEFSWQVPMSLKYRDGKGKWLLRKVLYRYVPRELMERPKMGFGVPIDSWLRGPLRDWAEELLSEKKLREEGILNPASIRRKWEEHLSGKRNWVYHLWDVLMFETWMESVKLLRWGE